MPPLKEFSDYFARGEVSRVKNPQYLEDTIERLKKMIFFIVGQEDINPYYFDGKPVNMRQKHAREIKVIDVLCDMLYYAFNSDIYFLNELNPDSPMTKIAWLVYRIIKHCV